MCLMSFNETTKAEHCVLMSFNETTKAEHCVLMSFNETTKAEHCVLMSFNETTSSFFYLNVILEFFYKKLGEFFPSKKPILQQF